MRALVLGSNATLVLNTVSALGAAGIEADVISDWTAPRVRFSRYCRRYVRVPFESLHISGDGLPMLSDYCRDNEIDVVIPADLATTFDLANLGDEDLPRFPVASPSTLETLHDKWRFQQLLRRHELPTPCTQLLRPGSDGRELELPFPVIVKPAASEGGSGIQRCEDAGELARLRAQPAHQHGQWIAQEIIPGHDIDLSVLADHGRVVAYTIQQDEGSDKKRFLHDPQMLEVGCAIVNATQFHGLAHFDMRVDERNGKLYVIECNPRIWGSLMYSVWAGVNFVALGCRVARGERLTISMPPKEHVWHQGVAPRRLFKALMQGRSAPEGMSGATLESWRQAHRDPWTQLIGDLTERNEARFREVLKARNRSEKEAARQ
jgi:hypothetical protein